jgi:transcription elongation GreA/GreB family factor
MSGELRTAEPLRPARDGEAEIGERVTVLDLTTSAVHDYRLVAADADPTAEGDVSISTALGSALLGRHVGDVVTMADRGHVSRLEIVEIDG